MSKKEYIFGFLRDSAVRQLRPEIACELGVPEAIILDQIRYWVTNPANTNIHEGRRWVYKSYEEWQLDFPFYSSRTIRRAIQNLEENEYILSANFHKNKFNRSKWYTLNDIISQVTNDSASGQNGHIDVANVTNKVWSKWSDACGQNGHMYLNKDYITKSMLNNNNTCAREDFCLLEDKTTDCSLEESQKEIQLQSKNKQEGLKSSIVEVFEYWQVVLGHTRTELNPERRNLISKYLKSNSVEKLKKAVDGCKLTPFYFDQNLTLLRHILKNQDTIDMFVKNAEKPPRIPINPNNKDAIRHSANQAAREGHAELKRKLDARAERLKEKEIEEARNGKKEELDAPVCEEVARIE